MKHYHGLHEVDAYKLAAAFSSEVERELRAKLGETAPSLVKDAPLLDSLDEFYSPVAGVLRKIGITPDSKIGLFLESPIARDILKTLSISLLCSSGNMGIEVDPRKTTFFHAEVSRSGNMIDLVSEDGDVRHCTFEEIGRKYLQLFKEGYDELRDIRVGDVVSITKEAADGSLENHYDVITYIDREAGYVLYDSYNSLQDLQPGVPSKKDSIANLDDYEDLLELHSIITDGTKSRFPDMASKAENLRSAYLANLSADVNGNAHATTARKAAFESPEFKQQFDRATYTINEYLAHEFGDFGSVEISGDVSELSNPQSVALAYTTTEDDAHEIQVYADLVNCQIIKYLDDEVASVEQYKSIVEMTDLVLDCLDFDDLTCIPHEELETAISKVEASQANETAVNEQYAEQAEPTHVEPVIMARRR